MAKKKKKAPQGAPLWVVSYGDMMSLLLTFFILLASMANYDEVSERFMTAIESIREALGMKGQVGTKKVDMSVDFHSLLARLESIVKPDLPEDVANSDDDGIHGKNFRVTNIRDGTELTIGGPITFKPFSAELTDEGKSLLRQVGDTLRGYRNKVEVRGHAAEEPAPDDWTEEDAIHLSFQRADAIANELILSGVDHRTLRRVACGSSEPIARGIYDPTIRGQGRRVEIIVRQSLIDDYLHPPPTSGTPGAQPVTASSASNQLSG